MKTKAIALIASCFTLSLALGLAIFAWTNPGTAPPDGNVAAPLNVGSSPQTKSGALTVGGSGWTQLQLYPSVNDSYNPITGGSDTAHFHFGFPSISIPAGKTPLLEIPAYLWLIGSNGSLKVDGSAKFGVQIETPKMCLGSACRTDWPKEMTIPQSCPTNSYVTGFDANGNITCSNCNCTSWTNASCGGGGCASNQRQQTRTCTPLNCLAQSQCVVDTTCQCFCTAWSNLTCGGGGCASNQRQQTRTCTPANCLAQSQCVADAACQCTNQCSPSGKTQCSGSSVQTCTDSNGDGCLEWSTPSACPSGQSCVNGTCVQTALPTDGKRIFVTANSFSGTEVETDAAADVKCASAASSAGFPGTYKALIYVGSRNPSSVFRAGFSFWNGDKSSGTWVWNLVAQDASDFFTTEGSNYLRTPIKFTEAGFSTNIAVWTAFKPNGSGGIALLNQSNCGCHQSDPSWDFYQEGPCIQTMWWVSGWPDVPYECAATFYGMSGAQDSSWSAKSWTSSKKYQDWASVAKCLEVTRSLYCVQQ